MKQKYIKEHAQSLANYLSSQYKYMPVWPSISCIWKSMQANSYNYLATDNYGTFVRQWSSTIWPILENKKYKCIDYNKMEQDLVRYEYLTNPMASDSNQTIRLKKIALFFFINCPFYVELPPYSVMLNTMDQLNSLLYRYSNRTMKNNYTEITKHFNNIRENYGNNKAC